MTLKQMIKDENLNLRKSKITCKPAQTFVKCSHLHLPPSLCPQNCSALFVGRTSNFIMCSPTKPRLCFAYLQPYIDRKITPSKSWFMKVKDTLKYLADYSRQNCECHPAHSLLHTILLGGCILLFPSINHAHYVLHLISVSTRTAATKFSIGGLCVCSRGLYILKFDLNSIG